MIVEKEIAEEAVKKLLRETVDKVANWEVSGYSRLYEEFKLTLNRTSYMNRLGMSNFDYVQHIDLEYRERRLLSANYEVIGGKAVSNAPIAKLVTLILERETQAREAKEKREVEKLAADTKELIEWIYQK